jgi:hypothetical protein
VSGIEQLRPGMIGFGPTGGWGGPPIWLAEIMLRENFEVGDVIAEHVFVVTAAEGEDVTTTSTSITYSAPRAVEAMPGGAIEVEIGERWTDRFAYVMPPEDYPGQARDAAAIARAMIGTPYSFASYVALAAWRFGVKTPRLERWIDRRRPKQWINGTRMMTPPGPLGHEVALPVEAICSVLADQAWALTGKQVMPAGTPHQCVTPGALARALLHMRGAEWLWPE